MLGRDKIKPLDEKVEKEHEEHGEEFSELFKFTLLGYFLGVFLGYILDHLSFKTRPFGEWIIRTLSGEGESVFESFYALNQRFKGKSTSMAEAYAWGKFFGMIFPWIVDFLSRFLGVDVYGVEGFYIPYFYALSDQIGANVSGLLFLIRKSGSFKEALKTYLKNPVMVTSLMIVLLVPVGLVTVRLLGFAPTKYLYVALETVAANLCWLPPFVGWLLERSKVKE